MTQTTSETLLAEVLERNELRFVNVVERPVAEKNPRTTVLDAIEHSTQSVFAKMCGVELELSEHTDESCSAHHFDVSGIVAISGMLRATVALHFPCSLIFACANSFLGVRPNKIDAETIDLVGELTNMVVGGAKERLGREGLTLGLPTVVAGSGHQIALGSGMEVSSMTFTSAQGMLSIDIGVKP